jgi:UDP-glucose 4-epimerase
MVNILITGSAGFIGKHLFESLVKSSEHNILGVDIIPSKSPYSQVCDIRNYRELESIALNHKPQVIAHLAAQAYIPKSFTDPLEDAEINIIGTINVVRLARKFDSKIVYLSSAAVYGNPPSLPVSEEHPVKPVSPYGLSKLTSEEYIKLLLPPGKYAIFRPSSIYGVQEGKRHGPVNSLIYSIIKQGYCEVTGSGEQTRDFIHVNDVARAIKLAINGKLAGTYNLGTGTEHSINQLLTLIQSILNRSFQVKRLPEMNGEIYRSWLNVEKLRRAGFEAKIGLKEGLKELIKYELEKLGRIKF